MLQILFISLYALTALAWPPTYGPEIEFSNHELRTKFRGGPPKDQEKLAAKKLADAIKKKCLESQDCEVLEVHGKWSKDYDVKFKNGFWINISYDPVVVEVRAKPATRQELAQNREHFRKYIFETAKEIGLDSEGLWGQGLSGHFNIGARSAFDDDARALMSFLVDYANHPELASGVLGRDFANAPPLSILNSAQREQFNHLTELVKNRKIKTISALVAHIQKHVYTWTPTFEGSHHYQAVGLKRIGQYDFATQDKPLELRAIRTQESIEEFELLAELFEARMEYLKTHDHPLFYLAKNTRDFTEEQLASRFFVYVKEMGLDWEKFSPLGNFSKSIVVDNFVVGNVQWDSPRYAALVREYAIDALSSPYIESKLSLALQDARAVTSGQGLLALYQIAEVSKQANVPPFLQDQVASLLRRALKMQDWAKSPTAGEYLKTIIAATENSHQRLDREFWANFRCDSAFMHLR